MFRRSGAVAIAALLSACGAAATHAPPPRTGLTASASPAPGSRAPLVAPDVRACRDAPVLRTNEPQRGSTTGHEDLFHASCAYGAASPDAVYRFHLDAPSHVALRVSAGYDSAVYLRTSCLDGDTEIVCNDDAPDERHSSVEADLPPGDYFAFVDGYESHHQGFYALTMTTSPSTVAHPPTGLARAPIGQGAAIEHSTGSAGLTGRVVFDKRHYTPHGLSRSTTETPAPHFLVEAVDADGHPLASTETGDDGTFRLDVAAGRNVRVRALTRTTYLGNDLRVVSDPGTERPYEVSTQPFVVHDGDRVTLHAWVGGVEPAGAFNILTQFVHYLPFVQRGMGRALPPLYAFWRRGNNGNALPQGEITAFLMDYHRHDGTYALQIQGGDLGHEDESDSDQFDDPVILHEFSHFVVHTMAGHFSIGGMHHNNELHFPGQALDEGAASAMGCAVAGDSRYWDTAGLEPTGEILVEEDSEDMQLPDRGIGSQNTAQTLMWDLIDGAENIADRDHDDVAIGLSGVMRIYASFHDDDLAFPGIHTVLERAVALHMITEAEASRLVHRPVNQGFAFPLNHQDEWPLDLTLPGEAQGLVDGHTQPAPSGGRNVPSNGLDAIKTYRIHVPHRGMVYIDLSIQGPGNQQSGTDLDLQLFTRNLAPVAQSNGETSDEHIRRILDPGTYIILVRDGDGAGGMMRVGERGNRANFTLRVRQSNEFH